MANTIKVQMIGATSVASVINSGVDMMHHPLTFHAFTDTMKARILESMIKNPGQIVVSFTDETPRTGEWHEPLAETATSNPI